MYGERDLFERTGSHDGGAGASAICRAGQTPGDSGKRGRCRLELEIHKAGQQERNSGMIQWYSLKERFLLLWKTSGFALKDSTD